MDKLKSELLFTFLKNMYCIFWRKIHDNFFFKTTYLELTQLALLVGMWVTKEFLQDRDGMRGAEAA